MWKEKVEDMDLTYADLEGICAERMKLINVNIKSSNGNFEKASFLNAKLDEVTWKGANIKNAEFDPGVKEKIEKLI